MSTNSGDTAYGHDGQYRDRLAPPSSLDRYDLVLTLIPVVFFLTTMTAGLFDVSLQSALIGASLIGALAVVDALFINPPTQGRRRSGR